MKEITFLKQNAAKWKQYESMTVEKSGSPKALSDLFIEITDDLAYSQTQYPRAKSTQYLNDLAAISHQEIYQNKREDRSKILAFWKYELPAIIGKHHKMLLLSFAVFIISAAIGWVSAKYDDEYVRLILGDEYVDMTIDNIEKGDPMGVYKSDGSMNMFVGITINNIRVSFLAYVAGLLFSFGTAYLLFTNGIMLGAFQYFFYSKGLLGTSILTIWIHGTLEISAIIIAGSAGFVLGKGLIFPGTYSRGISFTHGARDSVKIIMGLIPVFIIAGFLESFVTRYTQMPIWTSIGIISISAIFILAYFVAWPIYLNRKDLTYA
jgi:uncharacterized membrane protein SpoIIM required for sporulation